MKINVNLGSDSSFSMFNLEEGRAGLLLDLMSQICDRAYSNFETDYSIQKVQPSGDISLQLAIGKMVQEMVSLADTEDERNYILYCAHVGVSRVSDTLHEELEENE